MENKIYADAFGIIGGLFDLRIDFMSVDVMMGPNGAPAVENQKIEQRVILSMPLAKELSKKLTEAVAAYEATFGEVLNLEEAKRKGQQGV